MKIDLSNIDDRLSHLSEEEIGEVISKYEEKEMSVANICEEYNISISNSSMLVRLLPMVEADTICELCGDTMYRKVRGRSGHGKDVLTCGKCKHMMNNHGFCDCDHCKEVERKKREEARLKKEQEDAEKYGKVVACIKSCQNGDIEKFENMSFHQRLYLGVLLRHNQSEVVGVIEAYNKNSKKIPMAPSGGINNKIYNTLIDSHLLLPLVIESDMDYYGVGEGGGINFKKDAIPFFMNCEFEKLTPAFIEELIYPGVDTYIQHFKPFALELWKEMAKEEAREILVHTLEEMNVQAEFGTKTETLLDFLVDHFSTAQIYYYMWVVSSKISKQMVTGKMNRFMVFPSFISSLRTYTENAVANKWVPKKYNRLYKLPQSTMSHFIYNIILKVGEKGFTERPNQEILDKIHAEEMEKISNKDEPKMITERISMVEEYEGDVVKLNVSKDISCSHCGKLYEAGDEVRMTTGFGLLCDCGYIHDIMGGGL